MSAATGDNKKSQSYTSSIEWSKPSRFEFAEILLATNHFSESFILGHGRFGKVYKGTVYNGSSASVVAIKRLDAKPAESEFFTEVAKLSKLRPSHLVVSFLGYCYDKSEAILVYEHMPNGTLEDHLHKLGAPLSWLQRLKICIVAGRGLDYLHIECGVIHRDVKASKIFLHKSDAAKISSLGLSISPPNQTFVTRGTAGYLDPLSFKYGILTRESDVYSFGVILLEVFCRKPLWYTGFAGQNQSLLMLARTSIDNHSLKDMIDFGIRGQVSSKCLEAFVIIIERCLHFDRKQRPTMTEVVACLESVLSLQNEMNRSLKLAGLTESGRLLPDMLPFPKKPEFEGGSYFRQTIRLPSAKSHRHKEDHGPISDSMSEKVADAMLKKSHKLGKSRKKIQSSSQREFGDQTESRYLKYYIQQADVLMRVKDLLHLIWFYTMKKEAKVNLGSLLDKFSLLNEYIRKSMDSKDENCLFVIQTLLQDIEEDLNDATFDMVAFLPILEWNKFGSVGFKDLVTRVDIGHVHSTRFWSGIPEVHASAVSLATHRIVSCIKDLKVKKLGISGSGSQIIAKTLKDMPEVTRVFDMVLCVRVNHHSIKELKNDIEDEIQRWKKRSSETGNEINVLDQFPNCLLFVDCIDTFIDLHDPEFNLSKWFGTAQIVMTSEAENAYCPVDMEIRVEDHLLPWILFSTNVDLETVGKHPSIQEMATLLIEKCHGHLLAIIILARDLKGVDDVSVWELALQELSSQKEEPSSSELGVISDVMVRVLSFIWSRMETMSQRCIIQFALRYIQTKYEKSSLINSWIKDGSVKSEQEGEHAFEDLKRSFLLEQVGENCVRMRDETRVTLVTNFVPRSHGLCLKQDGSESNQVPNIEEWDAREIHLSNNIISELPDNPDCPILMKLFLHTNQYLMDIPIKFFNNMPGLEVLDLSGTSITCLPSTISKLTALRKLFIRGCDLLMELPPQIGALENLKVFDSEGTQLICLPAEFGLLTKLECLKFSLYNFADKHEGSKQSMQIIPAADLSKLVRLKEVSICVDSYCEWWEDAVKLIIDILSKVLFLESLRLYFPTTKLLEIFMKTRNWRGVPIFQQLSNFGIIVGHLRQRLTSRVPCDLHKTFARLPKSLTYTNGKGDKEVISIALKHANSLYLDRHWTVRSLSAFGLAELEKLQFCLLSECNELVEIVNESDLEGSSLGPVLGSLEFLSIHYMKSLACIWNGPIPSWSLSNLKTLAMHSCPELRTIFTYGLLDGLTCLEYLVVEDCTTINSLISLEFQHSTSSTCLPNLKRISLLRLPELVSISGGISIAPTLRSLVIFNCPKLEKLPYIRVSIREIKGENKWWQGLKWSAPEWKTGQPAYLAKVFVPLGRDGDILDELADAVNLLPRLGISEPTKEAETVQVNTRAGSTDKGKGKV